MYSIRVKKYYILINMNPKFVLWIHCVVCSQTFTIFVRDVQVVSFSDFLELSCTRTSQFTAYNRQQRTIHCGISCRDRIYRQRPTSRNSAFSLTGARNSLYIYCEHCRLCNFRARTISLEGYWLQARLLPVFITS